MAARAGMTGLKKRISILGSNLLETFDSVCAGYLPESPA